MRHISHQHTSIIDDFLDSDELPIRIMCAHDNLLATKNSGSKKWDPNTAACEPVPEPLAALMKEIANCFAPRLGFRNLEYWTNTLNVGQGIPLHQDKDEKEFALNGAIFTPRFVIIYYASKETIEGGDLCVANCALGYQYNRLIVFSGSRPHLVTPVKKGQRYSLVFNLWD